MSVCLCGRLNSRPRGMQVLIFGTCECYLLLQKGFGRCGELKTLQIVRLSWNMWVGPACNHKCPSMEGEGKERFDYRREVRWEKERVM